MRNVAFVTNDHFMMATIVAVTSFLQNNKEGWSIYLFYIKNNLSEKNLGIVEQACNIAGTKFYAVEVELDLLSEYPYTERLGYEAYVRLLFPKLLPQIDKLLYLDGDVVVDGELSSLFDLNITQYYLAAVTDLSSLQDNVAIIENLGYKLSHPYFNSGVLLMNLKKCREEDLEGKSKKLSKEKKNLIVREDQDILNCLCDKVKIVSPKYNLQGESINDYSILLDSNLVRIEEIRLALEAPVIYHYVITFRKPWSITCLRPSVNLWFYYLKNTYFKDFKIPFSYKYIFGGYLYKDLLYLKKHTTISYILQLPFIYGKTRIKKSRKNGITR